MIKFDVTYIAENLHQEYRPPVWASTPYNALNIVGVREYGAQRFTIVPDSSNIMGGHIRAMDGKTCIVLF